MVLRVVAVPAGLGVAARHRQGIPGQVEREALFLQVQLQPQPEPPPAVPAARRLLRDPRARHPQQGAEHHQPEPRPQSLAGADVHGRAQPDDGGRGPLLRLLWHGPQRPAERWSAHRQAFPGPRHRQHHRRHLLLVRRQVVQDRLRRQGHQVRRQLPRRAARLQGRRAVQQRRRRVGERLQRLHLHLRSRRRPTATRRIRSGAAAGCAPLASTWTTPSAGTASR